MENLLGIKVVGNVHHVRCPFSRPGYFTSVCAVIEKTVTLIDSGTSASPEEAIFPYLKSLGKKPDEISRIILTHAHFDHCGGVSAIKKRSNIEVCVHVSDEPLLEDPTLLNRQLNHRFPEIYPLDSSLNYEPIKANLTLKDRDEIILEDHALRVIHTPGHSEGSIALVDEKTGLCISGDSMQGRGERRPLLFFSSTGYVNSIKHLMKEPIKTLILGHPMPPFNKGVLHDEEVKVFLSESLKAIEELHDKVSRIIEENTKALSLSQISKRIPEAQPVTIGCIMESFLPKKIKSHLKSK